MNMNSKPHCLGLVLIGGLLAFSTLTSLADEAASPPATGSQSQNVISIWEYIQYPFPKPQEEWASGPIFLISSGKQWGQVSRGQRLDILNIAQGFRFFKTNAVTARVHRANGEVVEPTAEGKKCLKRPSAIGNASFSDEEPPPQVITYFPWGTNALDESWIEVSIPPDRYWLEVPYGFDRNPADPFPPSKPGGPPRFIPAMKSLTEQDHVVRWQSVHYDLGRTHDGCELSLIQSNPGDAKSEVDLYSDRRARNLYSPHTEVHLQDGNGAVINGRCVNLHLDDNHLRRTDTFELFDRGGDDLRCWGQLEIRVDDESYRLVVPSSLYKYTHGRAYKPATTDFRSHLRVGMKLGETDRISRSYACIRNSIASSAKSHQYQYAFKSDVTEVTLQFDESDRLVSWK